MMIYTTVYMISLTILQLIILAQTTWVPNPNCHQLGPV